jgi:hypothetical protein
VSGLLPHGASFYPFRGVRLLPILLHSIFICRYLPIQFFVFFVRQNPAFIPRTPSACFLNTAYLPVTPLPVIFTFIFISTKKVAGPLPFRGGTSNLTCAACFSTKPPLLLGGFCRQVRGVVSSAVFLFGVSLWFSAPCY